MSGGVTRTPSARRHTRSKNASPYSRPAAKKSAGWSFTGFLSYLNPLRRTSPSDEQETTCSTDEYAASRLARGSELELQPEGFAKPIVPLPGHPPPPIVQQPQPPPPHSLNPLSSVSPPAPHMNGDHSKSPRSDDSKVSSSENLKKVQQFLDEKAGRPLNHVELAGLVHLLQSSVEDDDEQPEPFRFSKSPSTPVRGSTPALNLFCSSTSEQMVSAASTAAQGARKTLAKNPMGVYRWQGGGSARPRNRYQSPGFGSTSSRSTIKLALEKPKTDAKRRRVGEEVTSSPQRAGAGGSSKANGSGASGMSSSVSAPAALSTLSSNNGRVNGGAAPALPITSRVRTNGLKPTTPVVPSPLRQTWGQSDSPPQVSPPQGMSKPTRAAHFMTELIKEVTPPKKPDFANPYEAANHMIKPAPKKQPVRRTRAAAQAEARAPKKQPELTPQAIIEATVPKGSKRSRPPPELIGAKLSDAQPTSPPESFTTRRSSRLNGDDPTNRSHSASKPTTVVNEISEEQGSPPKKQRTVKSSPPPSGRNFSITVEEIEDVDMPSAQPSGLAPVSSYTLPSEVIEPSSDKSEKNAAASPASTIPNFGLPRTGFAPTKSSTPKAPSKLRFSIQADKDEKMDATLSSTDVSAPPPPAVTALVPSPAPVAFALPAVAVPPAPVTTEKPKDARALALAMREDELPKYTFNLPLSSPGAGSSTLKARQTAQVAPVSALPAYDFSKTVAPASKPSSGFNWEAAGMKPPSQSAGDRWTCSACMLSSPATAVDCTVCEAPRAGKAKPAAAPPQGFNWAAAGMKPPPKPAGENWTCSVCMLNNPATAEVCTVCEAPRAGKAKLASAGFNWAAAGLKPPPKPAGGQWTCSVCMLSNPSDVEKCTVCDAPR